ncbi:hypothetical protein ACSU1N_01115 [Thermogladius sp. 4427co]|uniref:hypothetical protein n=1 Tax=Thermogladius sp. 4427co TaxID=3450718 RepID=UPI003F7ACB47
MLEKTKSSNPVITTRIARIDTAIRSPAAGPEPKHIGIMNNSIQTPVETLEEAPDSNARYNIPTKETIIPTTNNTMPIARRFFKTQPSKLVV